MIEEKKCESRIDEALKSRLGDIRTLYDNFMKDADKTDDELGHLYEYGLCIDRVEEGTFKDQTEAYTRYQLSYGGPSEEFRIFDDGMIQFWFLDWFDGASRDVKGEDAEMIKSIVNL